VLKEGDALPSCEGGGGLPSESTNGSEGYQELVDEGWSRASGIGMFVKAGRELLLKSERQNFCRKSGRDPRERSAAGVTAEELLKRDAEGWRAVGKRSEERRNVDAMHA